PSDGSLGGRTAELGGLVADMETVDKQPEGEARASLPPPAGHSYWSASRTFSRAARWAGETAAPAPAAAATQPKVSEIGRGQVEADADAGQSAGDGCGEGDAERESEGGADESGDDAFVADHPSRLPPGHADRSQHAELAGAFEDGEHERVDDPEQADDDREGEQDVEEDEDLVDALGLLLHPAWL